MSVLRQPLKRFYGRCDLHFVTFAFWQRRFHDFNVWSEKKAGEKLVYMQKSPVARKLVTHPKDWPWSNCSHDAKRDRGLITSDPLKERSNPRENPHP